MARLPLCPHECPHSSISAPRISSPSGGSSNFGSAVGCIAAGWNRRLGPRLDGSTLSTGGRAPSRRRLLARRSYQSEIGNRPSRWFGPETWLGTECRVDDVPLDRYH
jgi:hypothetical protein